jgi:hypothetical protein
MTKHLDGILAQRHLDCGMHLAEDADDFVYLYLNDDRVAAFGQRTTAEEFRREADIILFGIQAYQKSKRFEADASEWARDQGFQESR